MPRHFLRTDDLAPPEQPRVLGLAPNRRYVQALPSWLPECAE